MDTNTMITLLTVNVMLLSVICIVLLVITTIVLAKMSKIMNSVDQMTKNLAAASEWLSLTKVVKAITDVFRK